MANNNGKKIKRIYIAGLLTPVGVWSQNPAIDYLMNVRNMVRLGIEALLAGFDPFVPALDFAMFLLLREDERITEPMIKRYSASWIEACDAVLLVKGWRKSAGTKKEIELAKRLNIPVFESIEDMVKYNNEK